MADSASDDPEPLVQDVESTDNPAIGLSPIAKEKYDEKAGASDSDDDAEKEDTCRICRSEGTEDEPLFYPCKCSGSIKFVHQDCLMEWLSHTNKKHCELCKTSFRFTKLYDSQMPETLPFEIFLQRASMDALRHVTLWLRGLLVGFVWLILLPWCIRWAWRGLFFMLDAGWAREPWIARLEAETQQNVTLEANTTLVADGMRAILHNSSSVDSQELQGPVGFQVYKLIWKFFTTPLFFNSASPKVNDYEDSPAALAAQTSMFSNLEFIKTLTSSPYLNKIAIDVLEGQLITFLVVVAFILVFLIREWVIQQQPILNAAAHVREAEQQLNRVDQARNRFRGDIDNAEEQIRQVGTQPAERFQDETTDVSTDASGHAPLELSFEEPDSARSSTTHAFGRSNPDWAAFERRMRAALPAEHAVDLDHPESIVHTLTRQMFEIIHEGQRNDAPTAQTFERLRLWSRNIPVDVDSRWYSQLVAAVNALRAEQRQQNVEDHSGLEDNIQLPMPSPTGTANHSNEGLRIAQEHSGDQTDDQAHGDVEMHADTGRSRSSSNTDESWQSVDASSQQPRPFRNLQEQYERDEAGSPASEVPDLADNEEVNPLNVNGNIPDRNETTNTGEGANITARIEEVDNDRQESSGDVVHDVVGRRNVLRRLSDWFWGDIEIVEPVQGQDRVEDHAAELLNPALEDDVIADDQDIRPGFHDQDLHLPAEADPEVVAAAVEAGLDVEAAEEAEDLEGILELIGMQGPIVTLVQTAMFCGVLVTVTLWGAIGVPYLFGKLALLTIGDPILFLVILPLQIAANLGDILIDMGLIVVAGLAWSVAHNIATYAAAMIPSVPAGYVKTMADVSWSAFHNAATHLSRMFAVEETHDTIDSGFLLVSIQAHKSLQELKAEIGMVIRLAASASIHTWHYCRDLSLGKFINNLSTVAPQAARQFFDHVRLAKTFLQSLIGDNGLTMTVRAVRRISIEPAEAYWSGGDRTLTVLLGYSLLAMIGATILLRKEPFFTSETLRKIEKSFADVLKQAGGVLKVILIISIEMLAFPLYCGLLLDCALLPLFQGATFATRIEYASRSPYMFTFLHWFLGTAYMFNFALFVSMCRRILRSGVLYFIRDPDDPTFHPVRDVLERSVSTQLRKIAFSALVYGLLVILCLGGVIWGIGHAHKDMFPIRWTAPEPVLEFPLEFLFYNFLSPFLFKFIKPSSGLESVYGWWLRHSARQLRLSHFLFGERYEDEEGHYVGNNWKNHVLVRMLSVIRHPDKPEDVLRDRPEAAFVRSGYYVTAPASDQVRILRGQKVFEEVSEEEVTKSEKEQDCSLHGRANQKFRNVYVPPWFRLRIGLFLACLWTLSAAIGGGFTLVPLVLGRGICSLMLAPNVRVNDIWSFAIGLHVELLIAYVALKTSALLRQTRNKVSVLDLTPILDKLRRVSWCAAKSTYLYGFGMVVIPATFALVFQLYLTLPLRTYVNSMVTSNSSNTLQAINATSVASVFANTTETAVGQNASESAWLSMHTIYVLPDWTLGFLYGKLLMRIMTLSPTSLPHAAWRQITRNGLFDPDIRLATRAFILPTLLISTIVLLGPLMLAGLVNNLVLYPVIGKTLSEVARAKLYRYSYPLCASQALAVWCTHETIKATRRWRSKIKDEVYLIGERLHNFGEKKPPPGSKSVARKERH